MGLIHADLHHFAPVDVVEVNENGPVYHPKLIVTSKRSQSDISSWNDSILQNRVDIDTIVEIQDEETVGKDRCVLRKDFGLSESVDLDERLGGGEGF